MTQPPHWAPENTPYTDEEKQYHYPTPMEQLTTTRGNLANTNASRTLSVPPSTTQPCAWIASQRTC